MNNLNSHFISTNSRTRRTSLFAADLNFALSLDREVAMPLTRQLVDALRQGILKSSLPAGMRLPSTRRMADTLSVSRTVTQHAYEQLTAEGLLESRRGSGSFVVDDIVPKNYRHQASSRDLRGINGPPAISSDWSVPPTKQSADNVIDFSPGRTDTSILNSSAWKRAWRVALRTNPTGQYLPVQGSLDLRNEICGYLARSRGFKCSVEDIFITHSAADALDTACHTLIAEKSTAFLEEPGYTRAWKILKTHGVQLIGVAVDDNGLQVNLLPKRVAHESLIYVTPSHQYPLGHRMSVGRRQALVRWAIAHKVYIVEDDYDSEFRYDALPLPALRSLEVQRVVYVGTFSKVLSPDLRLGYMVVPANLRTNFADFRSIRADQPGLIAQLAIAHFIHSGEMEKHIWRMRRSYAEKRHALIQSLGDLRPLANVVGTEAGLHLTLLLSAQIRTDDVLKAMKHLPVRIVPLAQYCNLGSRGNGLVLGYGGLSVEQITAGALTVREAILKIGANLVRGALT